MKKLLTITTAIILALLSIYGKKDADTAKSPVYEIAIRSVNNNNVKTFENKRDKFINVLTAQKGVTNDREFKSFYAMPQPDTNEVFIGMTQYESMNTVGAIQAMPEIQNLFSEFAGVMSLKAYVFVQQTEGKQFDLSKFGKKEGQIVEVAVRRVHKGKEDEFNKYRKEFVKLLSAQPGVLESYEFKVVRGKDTEGLTVGMTVYQNKESFMKIAGTVTKETVTQNYFQTFNIVASQFAYNLK
ncbi:MAG: hypothetical protein H6550_04430 [Chitinophagales bacterium]|nr:hypothetical protein [Chitinophagales bacterium]